MINNFEALLGIAVALLLITMIVITAMGNNEVRRQAFKEGHQQGFKTSYDSGRHRGLCEGVERRVEIGSRNLFKADILNGILWYIIECDNTLEEGRTPAEERKSGNIGFTRS